MDALRKTMIIAGAEFRFAFRRGAPVVVTALVGLLVGAGVLIGPFVNLSQWAANTTMTPEKVERLASFGLTPDQWVVFMREMTSDTFVFSTLLAWLLILLALLFLPVVTSAGIPADRKFGISEMLRSTPISGWVYLAGKILGALAAVLLVAAGTLGLFFAIAESVLFGKLGFGLSAGASLFFIKLSLLDGLPILAWGTAIGVLVGVFFRSRRAAVFPGLLAGAASLVGWTLAFRAPAQSLLGMTDLAYCYLVQNYHSSAIDVMARQGFASDPFQIAGASRVGIGQVVLMHLTVIAALLLFTALARLWLKWKENF